MSKISLEEQEEHKKLMEKLAQTLKMLEENGTFTFYNPKKNGGLVMEYIPNSNNCEDLGTEQKRKDLSNK